MTLPLVPIATFIGLGALLAIGAKHASASTVVPATPLPAPPAPVPTPSYPYSPPLVAPPGMTVSPGGIHEVPTGPDPDVPANQPIVGVPDDGGDGDDDTDSDSSQGVGAAPASSLAGRFQRTLATQLRTYGFTLVDARYGRVGSQSTWMLTVRMPNGQTAKIQSPIAPSLNAFAPATASIVARNIALRNLRSGLVKSG